MEPAQQPDGLQVLSTSLQRLHDDLQGLREQIAQLTQDNGTLAQLVTHLDSASQKVQEDVVNLRVATGKLEVKASVFGAVAGLLAAMIKGKVA